MAIKNNIHRFSTDGGGRIGVINDLILFYFRPYRMRKIYKTSEEAYYVLTVHKGIKCSLMEKAEQLSHILEDLRLGTEQIIYNKNSIGIQGASYRLEYQIEAYKKADRTVRFDDDGIYTEMIHRMGIETAFAHLRRCCSLAANNDEAQAYSLYFEKEQEAYNRISKLQSEKGLSRILCKLRNLM